MLGGGFHGLGLGLGCDGSIIATRREHDLMSRLLANLGDEFIQDGAAFGNVAVTNVSNKVRAISPGLLAK